MLQTLAQTCFRKHATVPVVLFVLIVAASATRTAASRPAAAINAREQNGHDDGLSAMLQLQVDTAPTATPGTAGGADTAETTSTSTTSAPTALPISSTDGTSSSTTAAEANGNKGKDKKDASSKTDNSKSSKDTAEKLIDAAAGSADPTVPATPLMPQPGEELPVSLKQVLQDSEQASEALAPVELPVDTVTLSFLVKGIAPEAFTAQYVPIVSSILARLSGTSDKQWQSSVNYKGQAAAAFSPAQNPGPSQAPDTSENVPEIPPSAAPAASPSPVPVPTPSPSPAVLQSSPVPVIESPAPAVSVPTVPAVSPQPAVPSPSVIIPPKLCGLRGCAAVAVAGHRRTLLQQQEVQVRLSMLTTNPQLVVYRLAQNAQDKNTAAQLDCSSELCYRLGAAGVPFERGTIAISPNYDLTFSNQGASMSMVDEELANRRRIGGVAAGAIAGGFVLLLLLFTHKKWIRCCRARCAASGLKKQGKQAEKQQTQDNSDAPGNKAAAAAADQFPHYTRRSGSVGSRLIQHGKFDPNGNHLSTSSSGINTLVAQAAVAVTTTPWVTVVTPIMSSEDMHCDQDHGNQQQQQQQQQLSDVYHHANSFSRWVSESVAVGASPLGTPHSHAPPQTPDSVQLDIAAALPASPISNPMYEDRYNSHCHSGSYYAPEQQEAPQRFSPDQMQLLLGSYYSQHEQQRDLADMAFAAPSAPPAPVMILKEMRYSCSSNSSSKPSTRPATPVAGLDPRLLSTSLQQGGASAPAAAAASRPAAAAAAATASPRSQAASVVRRTDVATSISNASSATASWPVLPAAPVEPNTIALHAAKPAKPVAAVAQHGGVQYASLRAKYANRRPSEGV